MIDTVISAITFWKDLIVKVFGEYPLAAAFVTLAAAAAFFHLEKTARPNKASTNILIVLFGWVIAVPFFGGVLWLFGQAWDVVKAIVPPAANALTSLFSIYQKHPFLVLVLAAVALVAYFAWKKWRPNLLPSRFLRILVLVAIVTLAAHIASPFADILGPAQSGTNTQPPVSSHQSAPSSVAPKPSSSTPTPGAPSAPAPASSAPTPTQTPEGSAPASTSPAVAPPAPSASRSP